MSPLDRLLCKLPGATKSWTCPWFLTIGGIVGAGLTLSLATGTVEFAALNAGLGGWLIGQRT